MHCPRPHLLLLAAATTWVPAWPLSAQDAGPNAPSAAPPRPIEPREIEDAGVANVADAALTDAGVSPLSLRASLEPQPVRFGERFELVIEVTRPRGEPLTLPGSFPETEACARAGEVRTTVSELAPQGGPDAGPVMVKETVRIPYLALDTQELKTPALVLTQKDGTTLDVPALDVKVDVPPDLGPDGGPLLGPDGGPLAPGQVQLEAAASTVAYVIPDHRPYVVLGLLATAGVLLALVLWAKRRLRGRVPKTLSPPPPPPRPAHEVALERLEALLASGLLQRGETAVFVERLMDEVLRDYIAARFLLRADTHTTRELVKELFGITVAGLDVALVDELLKDADLVKFAKASIASERAHAMATRVRALIEGTAMVPTSAARSGARSDSNAGATP
jgi:hypothetical protein